LQRARQLGRAVGPELGTDRCVLLARRAGLAQGRRNDLQPLQRPSCRLASSHGIEAISPRSTASIRRLTRHQQRRAQLQQAKSPTALLDYEAFLARLKADDTL
jgi:hypothetical protein